MLNILKVENEINYKNNKIKEIPLCIKDLSNHPSLAYAEYSIFKENLILFQIGYFEKKFLNPNWKDELELDDWAYES